MILLSNAVRMLVPAGAAALLCLAAVPADAASKVYINDPGLTVTSIGNIVVGSKYRLSSVNFDQSLDSGGGTQNVPGGTNFLGKDLGNVAALNNKPYSFSFDHIAGQGFVYTMTSPTGAVWTQAWGSFTPPLGPVADQSAATLRAAAASGQPVGALTAPGLPFNALHIESRAEVRNGFSYAPTVTFSGLSFTSPGLTQIGALVTGFALTPGAGGNNPNFSDPNTSYYSEWLVADTDLAAQNWTLAGTVTLGVTSPPVNDIAEFIRFDISGKQVAFTLPAVPEPASWAMLIAGFGLVGSAMRRKSATAATA